MIIFTFDTLLPLTTGDHLLEIWTQYGADMNLTNDTLRDSITIYASVPSSLPLVESLMPSTIAPRLGAVRISCNLSGGWYYVTNTQGDDIDWRVHSGSTGTGGSGPSSDHTSGSGKYLYLEASGNNGSGCQNKEAILHSPCIDLTSYSQAELFFWYHAYGGAIGSLHVDVIANGIINEDVMAPIIGEQGNQWDSIWVDLSAYVGNEVVVVFRGYTGPGYQADLAIDDVQITASLISSVQLVDEEEPTIQVFPNPTSTLFTISSNENTMQSVSISDLQGKIVHQLFDVMKSNLDVSLNLVPGVYFVQVITTDQKQKTRKLIIR